MADEQQMVLRTEDLVKKYRTRTVVNHVSINVKQGEIVGLLGPNGAGKTTTFYMTVGLVTPNEGKIFLNDMEITKFPVYKRARNGIGYLAQEASIFRKMTVEDNICCSKEKCFSREQQSNWQKTRSYAKNIWGKTSCCGKKIYKFNLFYCKSLLMCRVHKKNRTNVTTANAE